MNGGWVRQLTEIERAVLLCVIADAGETMRDAGLRVSDADLSQGGAAESIARTIVNSRHKARA